MNRQSTSCGKGDSKHPRRSGLIGGSVLILIGLAFLLRALGLLGDIRISHLWPLILVVVGIAKLSNKRETPGIVEGLLLIGAGSLIQAHYFGFIHLQWSIIWPIGLVIMGVLVFWSTLFRGQQYRGKKKRPKAERSASYLDGFVILGGRSEEIDTQEFEGGDLFCLLGGFELDLRSAKIKGDEAVLNIRAIMGGMEIKVPDDWSVVVRGTPILGGYENKTRRRERPDSQKEQRLIIEGALVMGGVEIRN